LVLSFFGATNIIKIVNNLIFEQVKKIFAKTLRIIVFFTQKFAIKPSKISIWDQGSGKNLFRIPDTGSKRHRIPIRDTDSFVSQLVCYCST
jgi:hypothetical protein